MDNVAMLVGGESSVGEAASVGGREGRARARRAVGEAQVGLRADHGLGPPPDVAAEAAIGAAPLRAVVAADPHAPICTGPPIEGRARREQAAVLRCARLLGASVVLDTAVPALVA